MIKRIKNSIFKRLGILSLFFTLNGTICAQAPVTCEVAPMPDVDVCVNDCATFINLSNQVPGDTTCFPAWLWLMPGGTPSVYNFYSPPCVTYSTPGSFTVYLFGVDSVGDTTSINSQSFTVIVHAAPSAAFTAYPSSLCINEGFNAQINTPSTMPGATYDWDMGDGNLYPNWFPIVNHIYAQPGTYTVSACVTDSCGSDCQSQIVTVLEPQPRFSWEGTCKIKFTSDTTCLGQIISFLWDFGDPTSGTNDTTTINRDPTHTFAQNNVPFTVTHTVITSNGTFTYTAVVIQTGPPIPIISGYQTNNCGNGFLTYTVANYTPGLVYSWAVTNGSPPTDTDSSININWSSSGGYVVLYALDPITDCTGTDTLVIPACCDEVTLFRIDNTTASQVLSSPVFSPYVNGDTITGLPNNTHIVITGIFTVDVPLTFLNCALIDIGANTPVIVNPGQTLTFDNCTTEVKCDTMWDGIYLTQLTSRVNIINGSLIQQAKNAVYSKNGGMYFIENSTLRNNYKDIVVDTFAGNHAGIVRNTNFTMVGSFLPAVPAFPATHNKTVCAIEIIKNANITIGDPTLNSYKNNFTNVLVGVRSTNSIVTVTNCRFANINSTIAQQFTVPDAGAAIVAIGGKDPFYQATLTVGGAGLNRCVITNAKKGIEVKESVDVNVLNNNITDIREYGIRIQRSAQRQILIADNTIWNQTGAYGFNTAILILECYDATANIFRNRILQSTNVNLQVGTGIRVGLVTPGNMFLNVLDNPTIARVKTGIWLQNLTGKNMVYVTNNTVSFSKPNIQYTSVHAGIRLENCATIRIRYNKVNKSAGAPVLAMRPNLRGVSMENSTVTVISHNVFTRMGSGVYGWELCGGSSMVCDTFRNCDAGFFFSGGPSTNNACDIGDQVIDQTSGNPAPTGCKWNSCATDITGKIDSIHWYRDAYIPTTLGLALGSLLPANAAIFSSNQSACNLPQYFAPQAPIVEREQNAGQAVFNSGSFAVGSEQTYQGRRNAHRKLRANPTWMVIGTPQDSAYSGFYVANDQTNVGQFRNFEDMAAVDSVQAASNILTNITDSNYSETNLKVVYSIYQQTWMQGNYEFTPSDSALLYGIAILYASDAGEAVYSARVLLGLDVDEYGASSARYGSTDESTDAPVRAMSLYPNPATDQLTVSASIVDGQSSTIVITDLQGKVVMSQNATNGLIVIDVSALDNGMYFVQLSVDGILMETDKLEVIHE